MSDIPQEIINLAAEFGVSQDHIEHIHKVILATPELPVTGLAANGQALGEATIRVAREYDGQATDSQQGQSLVVISAEAAGVQVAFIVDRDVLAGQLTAVFPNVPSASGSSRS